MSDGLDLIIIDDDSSVCKTISNIANSFYTWGDLGIVRKKGAYRNISKNERKKWPK